MAISQKNAERAIKQVGLDRPGPMRATDRDELIVKASRLAEYYDRMDHLMDVDPTELGDLIAQRLQAPQR